MRPLPNNTPRESQFHSCWCTYLGKWLNGLHSRLAFPSCASGIGLPSSQGSVRSKRSDSDRTLGNSIMLLFSCSVAVCIMCIYKRVDGSWGRRPVVSCVLRTLTNLWWESNSLLTCLMPGYFSNINLSISLSNTILTWLWRRIQML